jgi:hypothetical protein
LLGSSLELVIGAIRAATRSDPQQAHTLYELIRLLTYALGVPLALVALATGIWLALNSPWGLFRHWWIVAKLTALLVTIGIGALVDGREVDALRRATGDGAAPATAAWFLSAGFGAQALLVLTAIVLAVFKPRGRTGLAARLQL